MNHFKRLLPGIVAGIALAAAMPAHGKPANEAPMTESVQHLKDYQVVEFRRYVTADGELAHFAKYFDAYFPEAFEQLGAMVFGQFTERGHSNRFTWLRGFHDINARPIVNAAFYYGPLWKEHRIKVNAILPDSDNVMLLRPLHPEHGISVLPAVDPVTEERGAQGIVVAQIFAVKKGSEDTFAKQAEAAFDAYRIEGVHPAGVLVSLDVPNNFPQLPIRTDGPFLVWLGVIRDEATLDRRLAPILTSAERSLAAGGLLRGAPERVVMDPTPRSRLRWLAGTGAGVSP
ncbi:MULTISPECIES: NIPSNAP family protein [unclassified Rhodanobacter]|uniref:NIPSNAP family protein n=1 Tax=unclassified Rhodanobacter TaxID=2621553 RepID=UPI001BDF4EEC|nr:MULTISPECIES: NIPSNAP family protein [unclassified Rhodanobacter]MBT2142939.1 NIPSNAP family protein [Rhodanobacter sp. LX-99]MBT2147988.1 NIPSNAP family protein [Rhodanobacter sp. LX-100]